MRVVKIGAGIGANFSVNSGPQGLIRSHFQTLSKEQRKRKKIKYLSTLCYARVFVLIMGVLWGCARPIISVLWVCGAYKIRVCLIPRQKIKHRKTSNLQRFFSLFSPFFFLFFPLGLSQKQRAKQSKAKAKKLVGWPVASGHGQGQSRPCGKEKI